nr:AAA family ATPase [Bacilli bacterium]
MIIVLTGPTGTGKSKMAISLAKKLGGAIINADAFQVYRELSIATAKPTEDMMMQAPHYLFDFVPLNEDYNVAEYQKDLRANIALLRQSDTPIIIAGGTGLYIRAGLYDYE